MRSIDIHAHLTPQCFWRATENGGDWHSLKRERDARGRQMLVAANGERRGQLPPKASWTPEQRLDDMDSLGVDVHVVSPFGGFYNYHLDADIALATSRECNDEINEMMKSWPDRFSGLATLPMQDVPAAIAELERVTVNYGFKGAMIDDKINGKLLDEPEFMPFWKAAEQLGSVILFHQGGDTIVDGRIQRYHLPNSVGNLADRTLTFASLVMGGVMDACPDLRICLSHGGGFACYGAGRMDRGWDRIPPADRLASMPPSRYLEPFLLRLHRLHRAVAAVPHRLGRHRAGVVRHRLALRHGAGLARVMDPEPGEPDSGREGRDPLEEPRKPAGPLVAATHVPENDS